jgi:hypothetical protein
LTDVEPGVIGCQLLEFVHDSHEVSTFHHFDIYVNNSLVLRATSHLDDVWMVHFVHERNFVEQVFLLFVLNKVVLALNLHSHVLMLGVTSNKFFQIL